MWGVDIVAGNALNYSTLTQSIYNIYRAYPCDQSNYRSSLKCLCGDVVGKSSYKSWGMGSNPS